MKRLVPLLAALALGSCFVHERTVTTTTAEPVSSELFEGTLAPYGQWIVTAPYGRVWRPGGLTAGWRPYFYGEWAWTVDGWYWVTDEPWGWATYHYGRWVWDPVQGWLWIPGTEWAPAWVAWRFGAGFVGWAPLGPFGPVWWDDPFYATPAYWVFVPLDLFVGVRVERVVVAPARVADLIGRARPAPPPSRAPPPRGAPVPAPWGGPPRALVEERVGRPIPPARLAPVPTPAQARGRGGRAGIPAYVPPPAPRPPGPAPAPASAPAPTPGRAAPAPAPGAPPPARAAPPSPPQRVTPPPPEAASPGRPAPAPQRREGDDEEGKKGR